MSCINVLSLRGGSRVAPGYPQFSLGRHLSQAVFFPNSSSLFTQGLACFLASQHHLLV